MTRREIALDSFWTERPLVRLYIERTGRHTFSLRELIAFAEQLPARTVQRLSATRRGEDSQSSPHVTTPTRRPSKAA